MLESTLFGYSNPLSQIDEFVRMRNHPKIVKICTPKNNEKLLTVFE